MFVYDVFMHDAHDVYVHCCLLYDVKYQQMLALHLPPVLDLCHPSFSSSKLVACLGFGGLSMEPHMVFTNGQCKNCIHLLTNESFITKYLVSIVPLEFGILEMIMKC